MLSKDPLSIRLATGLPPLAWANLLSAAFETTGATIHSAHIAYAILELAQLLETLSTDDILRSINEDRAIAGFPEVKSSEQVDEALAERKRHYRDVIKAALNRMPSAKLIEIVTGIVQAATQGGTSHAPALIDDFVDSYEVESQDFLHKEADNVRRLIDAIRGAAAQRQPVQSLLDKLIAVATNWRRVAYPIQASAKARGMEHKLSHDLAFSIRNLAVDLFNKYELLGPAQQLTDALLERFSDTPAVSEKLAEDKAALVDISLERAHLEHLAPIRSLCETATKNCESDPKRGDVQGQQLLAAAQRALAQMETNNVPKQLLSRARNEVAGVLMKCAIAYGNAMERWQGCIPLLQAAHSLADDADLLKHIAKNLDIVRSNQQIYDGLEPISSAPWLYTINGFGTMLYGDADRDSETGSFIATYYVVLLAIPVFPLARYRVIQNGRSYRFLGKAPLRSLDKWHIATAVAVLGWLLFFGPK